jgi:FkbM family methyltransferase
MNSIGSWISGHLTGIVMDLVPQPIKDRLIRRYSIPDVDWSLRNAKKNGFFPDTIVDVGAHEGRWTRTAHRIYPRAKILAVEPLREKQEQLESLSQSIPQVQYETALLGAEKKSRAPFYVNDMVSSVLPEREKSGAKPDARDLTTLDRLTENTSFAQPDFLKLDVQGFELEVLRGGGSVYCKLILRS